MSRLSHYIRQTFSRRISKNVNMGKNSYINLFTFVFPGVNIGNYCSIGPHCSIGATTHPLHKLSIHPFVGASQKPLNIGNDVWIGSHVVTTRGISIGDGAVIGACSFVNKDIPPYAIAFGTPARVTGYRFSDEIIAELLELKWWELEIDDMAGVQFDDINKAIEQIKEIKNHRQIG